jgi:exodeoxyribonuclease V alpha subunit
MNYTNDLHQQFAEFFTDERIKPYAYLVYKQLQDGNICINVNDPERLASEVPYPKIISPSTLASLSSYVSDGKNTILPFVLHKEQVYLQRYFTYETTILRGIGRLIAPESSQRNDRLASLQKIVPFVEGLMATSSNAGIPLDEQIDWQMVAAIQSVLHNFSIITGGPGTGKTTTVAKVLSILFTLDPAVTVALAAPTGKAAMRMAESLKNTSLSVPTEIKEWLKNLSPNTIHRLLKSIPDSIHFKHNASNPLPYDVLVIDEASMIDVAMFAKLLDAVGSHTRVILLGDKNQLASVEAGSLFGDLCKALQKNNELSSSAADFINQFIKDQDRKITRDYIGTSHHPLAGHVIELKRSHRFNSSSGIGKLSHAIINNDEKVLAEVIANKGGDSIELDLDSDDAIFNSFVDGYKEYILETDISKALEKFNKLRVLCAVREGADGLYSINKMIENYLSKHGLINNKLDFYENRPIIITRNYKELKLFNGDIGIIRKDSNGNLRAFFEDSDKNIRAIMPVYISDAETVFAMTIHKSQGSEYNKVMVVLPKKSSGLLLTRELLYTAITRAKEHVIIRATGDILIETSKATVSRTSGINNRFDEI